MAASPKTAKVSMNPSTTPPPAQEPPRNPSPPTGAAVATGAAPAQAQAPAARPAPPPPPEAPRKPRRPVPAQALATPSEPAGPVRRVLPEDPEARAKALSSVRGEAELIIQLVSVLASRIPPLNDKGEGRPLSKDEIGMIQDPLEQVLYKYDVKMGCEMQLMIGAGFIAAQRFAEFKQWKKEHPDPEKK